MMTDQPPPSRRQSDGHGDGVHWEVTRQHAKEIGELRESNARQEEVLSSVMRDVSSTRDDIAVLIQKVSEPPPATDLAKMIGTTIGVLSLFGALVVAYVSPILDDNQKAVERIDKLGARLLEQSYRNGKMDAEMEAIKSHLIVALGEKH